MHQPIFLEDIAVSFSDKVCFKNFSTHIYPGSRIGIIGRNGCGKSSLLKLLRKELEPIEGKLFIPDSLSIGYVEQVVSDFDFLSGGERFNKKLSKALSVNPDLLLLDEPTNHLDVQNRKGLMGMLDRYRGTLIVVSHDKELLRSSIDSLWAIEQREVYLFSGSYDDYLMQVEIKRECLEKQRFGLKRDKKETHKALMKEQKRAAKSKAKGQKSIDQRKWPTVVSKSKASRAEKTSGKKRACLDTKRKELNEQLSKIKPPPVIYPKFSIQPKELGSGNSLSITDGNIGYTENQWLLKDISLFVSGRERVALSGKNGSGKSTLLKAILGDKAIYRTGSWCLQSPESIGYLDQHYQGLELSKSIFDHLLELKPDWTEPEIRRHLSDFLFCKADEVYKKVALFSGGEKARAALSLIAAKTPKLLILDEVTNNLDLETKNHVIQVLKEYPGSLIIISHDQVFMNEIGITTQYTLSKGNLR